MKRNELLSKIHEIAEFYGKELGYEILEVEYKKNNKIYILTIYIYKKEGINFDDCTLISEKVGEEIDKLNLIDDVYYLEVSSPGIDRPIKTNDDYRRNLGNFVEVKLYTLIDNKKTFEGNLANYDENYVYLTNNGEEFKLPIDKISIMRQKIIF